MPSKRDVDDWLVRYDHPTKAVVMRMRDIVIGADERIAGIDSPSARVVAPR
jgi:hypothetical protein